MERGVTTFAATGSAQRFDQGEAGNWLRLADWLQVVQRVFQAELQDCRNRPIEKSGRAVFG